ncbi:hypothetical protein BCR33DRAFT_173187 [Rhizoclosmatium globosum]|uniref:Uncharacterized protein n=1 Tax=Rhizoclosmatium globosum TaxID=329046 RepID=A0A1Y2CFA8_9FUNG|nr:hypothetical protein BCR33DRAFT_173187 [Rhizoclosmatium globosum]|eukprot:ORY45719.1 hypothetical protein BCR33DRAFT_173187 [Rhizoclosmatium globosum]
MPIQSVEHFVVTIHLVQTVKNVSASWTTPKSVPTHQQLLKQLQLSLNHPQLHHQSFNNPSRRQHQHQLSNNPNPLPAAHAPFTMDPAPPVLHMITQEMCQGCHSQMAVFISPTTLVSSTTQGSETSSGQLPLRPTHREPQTPQPHLDVTTVTRILGQELHGVRICMCLSAVAKMPTMDGLPMKHLDRIQRTLTRDTLRILLILLFHTITLGALSSQVDLDRQFVITVWQELLNNLI